MHEFSRILDQYVKPGMIVFDIGANVGEVSRFCAERGAIVTAFEPQCALADHLRDTMPNNVAVEQMAVGAITGLVDFYCDVREGMNGVASSCMVLEDLHAAGFARSTRVESVRLDDYVREHCVAPGFLKIDVEGCEPDVFTGGLKTLADHRPVLLFEFWESHLPRYRAWFEFLSKAYRLTRVPGGREVLSYYTRDSTYSECIDILAVPL